LTVKLISEESGDQWRDQVGDQRVDDSREGHADDHGHREIHQVAAGDELPELGQGATHA
jgi:hypothetical protein